MTPVSDNFGAEVSPSGLREHQDHVVYLQKRAQCTTWQCFDKRETEKNYAATHLTLGVRGASRDNLADEARLLADTAVSSQGVGYPVLAEIC